MRRSKIGFIGALAAALLLSSSCSGSRSTSSPKKEVPVSDLLQALRLAPASTRIFGFVRGELLGDPSVKLPFGNDLGASDTGLEKDWGFSLHRALWQSSADPDLNLIQLPSSLDLGDLARRLSGFGYTAEGTGKDRVFVTPRESIGEHPWMTYLGAVAIDEDSHLISYTGLPSPSFLRKYERPQHSLAESKDVLTAVADREAAPALQVTVAGQACTPATQVLGRVPSAAALAKVKPRLAALGRLSPIAVKVVSLPDAQMLRTTISLVLPDASSAQADLPHRIAAAHLAQKIFHENQGVKPLLQISAGTAKGKVLSVDLDSKIPNAAYTISTLYSLGFDTCPS
jgi:hypothetical protein